ncbi:prephenate dehydrogenase, partial [Candidatus Sumerlaeota bacterium]|nr:prephenate dehydrogenase [Candidatus Sumerlaeota bacterium]
MKPSFKRVVIHGVGLLGGSLGMALRGRGLAREVVGLGRSEERLEKARDLGSLDCFTTQPREA